MRMNFLKLTLVGLIFVGCGGGKQNDAQLAQTYFKMAFADMAEENSMSLSMKRALVNINKALECDERPEYYAFKGTVLCKLGDYTQSEKCYKKALGCQPDAILRAEISNNRACLLAQHKKYTAAQKVWRELIHDTSYQTPEVAWVNLGKIYAEKKKFKEAKDAFEHATMLAPSYIDAHFYLGLVERELGDRLHARREADLILKMEPEHYGAHMLMATMDALDSDIDLKR
jgi:Tfp pilus assembly protein PilF